MREEIIYIHHMLTPRDVLLVRNELERLGLQVKEVEIGTAAYLTAGEVSVQELEKALEVLGYQVLSKKDKLFMEKLRGLLEEYLAQLFQRIDLPLLSVFLEQKMGMVYGTLSRRFRKIEQRTLESYFKGLKAEKVKSLLLTTDLSIEDIALRLNYRSSRSLARMFREATGVSIKDLRKGERAAYLLGNSA